MKGSGGGDSSGRQISHSLRVLITLVVPENCFKNATAAADFVRQAFTARLGDHSSGAADTAQRQIYSKALGAARQAVLAMRAKDEIGDDAFHQLEEELDRLEIAVGTDDE